jgi:hypothetical protein
MLRRLLQVGALAPRLPLAGRQEPLAALFDEVSDKMHDEGISELQRPEPGLEHLRCLT